MEVIEIAEQIQNSDQIAEIVASVEDDFKEMPKPEMINPNPFEKRKLPHEKYRFNQ